MMSVVRRRPHQSDPPRNLAMLRRGAETVRWLSERERVPSKLAEIACRILREEARRRCTSALASRFVVRCYITMNSMEVTMTKERHNNEAKNRRSSEELEIDAVLVMLALRPAQRPEVRDKQEREREDSVEDTDE